MKEKGKPFLILLIAVAIVAGVSLIPLNKISGGKLKDFSLISDLKASEKPVTVEAETYLDPDLEAVMSQELPADEAETQPVAAETETEAVTPVPVKPVNVIPGEIEDYTPGQEGLTRLRQALYTTNGNAARIAMLGDSYIEGDILSEAIRENLQQEFGGKGAGYVPAHSKIAGFRSSVRQSGNGWKEHEFKEKGNPFLTLSGYFYTPAGNATATIKGSKKPTHTSDWNESRILFVAPTDATITTRLPDEEPVIHEVTGSQEVQCISVISPTAEFSFSCSSPDVKILGVYLDDRSGIALDNMSVRGYAGIRHNQMDLETARQMRRYVDYQLIILEYGINALSGSQTNYKSYAKLLGKSIDRIKEAYPDATILLMGIGDRGIKHGSEVISMPTVPNMIEAQRDLAREKEILFWDTREAMGGEGAVVEWAAKRDINKDYIHLSRQGGQRLGAIFSKAIANGITR